MFGQEGSKHDEAAFLSSVFHLFTCPSHVLLAEAGDGKADLRGGDDFASQIGTGAVIGSKFTWPEDNPDVTAGSKFAAWIRRPNIQPWNTLRMHRAPLP